MYRIRYQCDPLIHGDEEPSSSSQYEQCVWHYYPCRQAPREDYSVRSGPHRGWATGCSSRVKIRFLRPRYLRAATFDVPSTMLEDVAISYQAVGTRYVDPDCMRKGEGHMSWSWRDWSR